MRPLSENFAGNDTSQDTQRLDFEVNHTRATGNSIDFIFDLLNP
jgi:hypothetical protein